MAGLYDLDPDAQVVDDVAIAWDAPDNAPDVSPFSRSAFDTLLGTDTATRATITRARTATDTLLGTDSAIVVTITGPALVYLAVESNLAVPGWTLSLPQPLLYAPVDGETNVPGWFLWVEDPIDEPMTADVFLLADLLADPLGAVPLVTLDQCTDPDDERSGRAWEWQDTLAETGSGSITVAANDPDIAVFDTDDLLCVAFNMYGLRVFLVLLEEDDVVEISDNDEVDEATRFSGRGTGVLLEFGDVDPTGGPYRSPVEEDRHFGWPAPSFDHSAWPLASILGTVNDSAIQFTIAVATFLSVGFFDIIDDQFSFLDQHYPSRDVPVVWAPGSSTAFPTISPAGDCYFYEEFTIASAGDYVLWFACDNLGTFYVDGQKVGNTQGVEWFGNVSVPVTLSVGTHSIAAVVTNIFGAMFAGYNPGMFTWCVTDEQPPKATTAPPGEAGYTIFAQISGACLVLPYPAEVPGQAVTKTIRLAVEEAQARGFLVGITLGFTDTTYSDGLPVILLPDVATKVGTSVLGFMGELAQTYIDWALDPVTFVLDVWDKGEQGSVTPAVFAVGSDQEIAGEAEAVTANIVSVRRKRERRKVVRLLLKWPGGWAESLSGSGGGEAPLELGAAQSLEEVLRIATGEFALFGDPRTQIDIGLVPEQRADAPYLTWRKGDWITYLAMLERVITTTVGTTDNPDDPDITVTLRDTILTPEERQARDIRSLL